MPDPVLFDTLPDGRKVHALHLQGPALRARVLTLGATVQDLRLSGVDHPLVLGFKRAQTYLSQGIYVGAIVGRFANRIANGRFRLDGRTHDLNRNDAAGHCLHGGVTGTQAQVWDIVEQHADHLVLSLHLPDGHMGFPGAVDLRAEISVADGAALVFRLRARSDAATPLSLAHHGYFNLDGSADIAAHRVQIDAPHYLPVDHGGMPTGEIAPVGGTRFDFRSARVLGGADFDHNFCLSAAPLPCRAVAHVTARNGLRLTVATTAPGLQLYDGRHFDGVAGLDGRRYGPRAGLALECQHWPDAPNQPGFPDAILRPGAVYHCETRYDFALKG